MKVKLEKEPDNEYDKEAIQVKVKGLGKIGYVANSPFTVKGESMSAGRLYDKIGDKAKGKVVFVVDRHANLKYKYGNRRFWAEGYYVDTVGKNKKVIEEYIKKQLQEDIATDQMVMKEFVDPFTGEKEDKIKKKKGPFQW